MVRKKNRSEFDIATSRSSKKRTLTGEFLEGTESVVEGIEPTATTAFSDAWAEAQAQGGGDALDAAIDVGQDDDAGRDLDRRRTGSIFIVALLIGGAAAIAYFATTAATAPDPSLGVRASTDTDRNLLASPLAEREYTELITPVIVTDVYALDETFISDAGSDDSSDGLVPDDDATAEFAVAAGTVFWAGRTHIAVVSDDPFLETQQTCLITSLVTPELQAVDVASTGDCSEEFDATGDRLACSGATAVLLEVWPLNPDSVTIPQVATGVRTRIETTAGTDVSSQRGSLELAISGPVTPLLASATTLNGAPGDTVTLELGNLSGACTLVDRSTVDVRLLPG